MTRQRRRRVLALGVMTFIGDNTLIPLELTEQEKQDLVAFLRSLTGEGWQQITPSTEFPK